MPLIRMTERVMPVQGGWVGGWVSELVSLSSLWARKVEEDEAL